MLPGFGGHGEDVGGCDPSRGEPIAPSSQTTSPAVTPAVTPPAPLPSGLRVRTSGRSPPFRCPPC